jgi:DNA-binding MarR family transcriptional regulator
MGAETRRPKARRANRSEGRAVLDPVRLSAWRGVAKVHNAVAGALVAAMTRDGGVPVEWYDVLLHLHESPHSRLRQVELEERSSIGSTGVSRMLSKMQQAGLIVRTQATDDRRALDVEISPLGEQRLARATPIYLDSVQETFGRRLENDEAATLAALLNRLANRSADQDADGDENAHLVPFGETVLAVTSGAMAASDAIEIRNALEPLVLVQAARDLTSEGAAEMRLIVGKLSNCLEQPEEFFRTDWHLHRVIARRCQNASLAAIYLSLVDVIEAHLEYVVPTANLNEYLNKRLIVHARLVDAICSRDKERVLKAADEHYFTSSRPQVVADISETRSRTSTEDGLA